VGSLRPQDRKQARVDRSIDELNALARQLDAWVVRRESDGRRGQYKSQIHAIKLALDRPIAALRERLNAIDTARSESDVYEECRLFDQRIVWVQRIFAFFRERFDQRENDVFKRVLFAADEIVWSCYREVVARCEALHIRTRSRPAPLPFIEHDISPEAFPADLVPPPLSKDVDAPFFKEFLAALPVPVVRLPPFCVSAPWWLTYLGHEVGHHVQFDVLKGGVLLIDIQTLLEREAAAGGGGEHDKEAWGNWAREIFADTFSILVMGPWAVDAITEIERAAPAVMQRRRPTYPSPAVRLKLMAALAARLKLPKPVSLDGAEAEPATPAPGTREHLDAAIAERVAGALLEPLPSLGKPLAAIAGFQVRDFVGPPEPAVVTWRKRLKSAATAPVDTSLRAARIAASAALAAFFEVSAIEDKTKREEARAHLTEQTLSLIASAAEPGERAEAETDTEGATKAGDVLAEALLRIGRDQPAGGA
jgi:hypothetical protein